MCSWLAWTRKSKSQKRFPNGTEVQNNYGDEHFLGWSCLIATAFFFFLVRQNARRPQQGAHVPEGLDSKDRQYRSSGENGPCRSWIDPTNNVNQQTAKQRQQQPFVRFLSKEVPRQWFMPHVQCQRVAMRSPSLVVWALTGLDE